MVTRLGIRLDKGDQAWIYKIVKELVKRGKPISEARRMAKDAVITYLDNRHMNLRHAEEAMAAARAACEAAEQERQRLETECKYQECRRDRIRKKLEKTTRSEPMSLSNYSGYLYPYLDHIIQYYRTGLSPTQIADQLGFLHTPYGTIPTSGSLIRYVLVREGVIEPTNGTENTANTANKKRRARQAEALKLHSEGLKLQEIGDRLGITRQGAQQLIAKAIRYETWYERANRALKIINLAVDSAVYTVDGKIILFASPEARACEADKRDPRGRPIDMGGPRDEWIERDPWSKE